MDGRASGVEGRAPSGLFPSGPLRPTFREPHPVRPVGVVAGSGVAAAWMALVGLLGDSAASYAWLTIGAGLVAGVAAVLLARAGDRGAAAGVSIAAGFGLSVALGLVLQRWVTTGWPLW